MPFLTTRAFLIGLALFLAPTVLQAGVLSFEKSPYGLLFADIEIDGESVPAMIDFGDPHVLQLATSYLHQRGIETHASGQRIMDANGNTFDLLTGRIGPVVIGGVELESVRFGSAPGEIDSVAEQVGTPFRAAVGWGFFGAREFLLDYAASKIRLDTTCPDDVDAEVQRRPGASYLIVEGWIGQRRARFLIDTGSPVNVLDRAVFEAAGEPGDASTVDHVAGAVEGRSILMKLDQWASRQSFEIADLSALKPLGVDAVLGGTFLAGVRICHQPSTASLAFDTTGPEQR